MLLSPAVMHIPDGFLSTLVSLVFWGLSAGAVSYALKRVGRDLGEREVPLMGVLAAAIFAGQMLNFAVAGGTSGHLLGAALAVILLGPWAAVLVMTAVVSVQALVFQDGGLLALGANLFNMAVVGPAVAYAVYRAVRRLAGERRWGTLAGGAIAAWASVEVTALAVALQLAISGTSPANLAVPAMAGIHALIGTGEALITAGALSFVAAARPSLLRQGAGEPAGSRGLLVGGSLAALLLAVLSPLASSRPDGLERVAEDMGFINAARGPAFNIIPDYVLPGVSNQAAATILAGVLGTLLVLGVSLAVAYSRRRKSPEGGEHALDAGQVPVTGAHPSTHSADH